ncbi:MAG: hypothetical protein OEW52_00190 [Thermoleophilia bacterium]|nr:hypothetical protein [Thermoleophilia bacterium]
MTPDTPARDPRLPFTMIEERFLAPRDPVLGFVKIGGKDPHVRFAKSGRPWVAPSRYVDPPRFEVTNREKRLQIVEGQGKAKGEKFTVDLGYVRDAKFHKVVGENPAALRVRLLYPRWHQNLIAFLGAHSGTKWICRGNGVEAVDLVRGACACPCPRLKQFEGTYEGTPPNDHLQGGALYPCKPHGQLNVLLEDADVFGGFHAFKTTSFESISNLTKALRIFEDMFGRVDGIPFELRVMAATKSYGEGTTTQPIVTLVLPASMSTARQVAADAAAESRKYLPAGELNDYREAIIAEMETEAASYVGEFVPETQDPDAPTGPAAAPAPTPAPAAPARPARAPTVTPAPAPTAAEEEDEGPDHELAGDDEPEVEAEASAPTPPPADDSGRNEEGAPAPANAVPAPDPASPADRLEATCRAILEADGWQPQPIEDRLAHHRRQGLEGLRKLLDGLKVHRPDAWAKVNQGGLFDSPPNDGLPL